MIKIDAYKIEYQLKNKHLSKIMITLFKTNKYRACTLFPNQFNIEG